MNSFWRIFFLELIALIRSKTLALLALVSSVWMVVFPYIVKGDGTYEGARELYIRFSLGGVFSLLVVSLLSSATGSIANERLSKRLDLTLVRPVRFVSIALGKILAHVVIGSFVLALACVILLCNVDFKRQCSHLYSPILPTAQEEAKMMYDVFINSPETPEPVKKAKKSTVLRILEQRARDHYQTIATNSLAVWRFDKALYERAKTLAVKVRFKLTNANDMRDDVKGTLKWGLKEGVFSSITRTFIEVPLSEKTGQDDFDGKLQFKNEGNNAIMLRPRQDIHLMLPADAFGFNLFRSYIVMVSLMALVISFGVFLSSSLSRPVALFSAIVLLLVSEISPSISEQYPDQLETDFADRIGLYITRFSASFTQSISSSSPLEALSRDECVETGDVARAFILDFLVLSSLFALLSAFIMRHKREAIG